MWLARIESDYCRQPPVCLLLLLVLVLVLVVAPPSVFSSVIREERDGNWQLIDCVLRLHAL